MSHCKIRRFGERFWVQIIHECDQTGTVVGLVDNDLTCPPEHLKCGDKVVFNRDEILEGVDFNDPLP